MDDTKKESQDPTPSSIVVKDEDQPAAQAEKLELKEPEVIEGDATIQAVVPDAAPTPTPAPVTGLTKQVVGVIEGMMHRLMTHKIEDHEVATHFLRKVNKRLLPDYFDVIKEPMAFSTIKQKLLKKQYAGWSEFVRDVALISHNAQVYNRPSAPVYQDAVQLREVFKVELQKLVEKDVITAEEAQLPDLGEIPEVEDSPLPDPEDEEPEEEDEEEEEEEEEDDSDDDRPRRRGKGRRSSTTIKKTAESSKDDPETQKKRGRPPKVHTPMEARINAILKGLRKFKSPGTGDLKIIPFEKLPDKSVTPDYYQEIKNPIAMDLIKRKAKRKKYTSVDQAMKDLELMFENAKSYNMDDSVIYKDAVELQKEARILAEQEKKRPDSDFVDEDGRLPLSEILYNGELWKVGDWIHLTNPNDVTKPIVAQIYRTWQDPQGQKWINACWYYRPEQTVHQYERHFFENEVVKTGQYRDHKIDEVVDRCFVMFFTRYNKGRPRGFPADKEVYVCEARYNEEKHKLNKIKTWASCVPDEVREKDYEMDLFDAPRKMKKVPSPIKHLLREDAKEDDDLPKPTWGAANAPPIVGAVHKRPREANVAANNHLKESPPPSPTPTPPPPEPEPARRPTTSDRPRYDSQGDVTMAGTQMNAPLPSPSAHSNVNQTTYAQQFAQPRPSPSPAPVLQHQTSYSSQGSGHHAALPQAPIYHQPQHYNQYPQTATTPVAQLANPLAAYNHYTSPASRQVAPVATPHASATNAYNPPRAPEVYTLADSANAAIPADIRAQFHQDERGRIIFYTAPPLDVDPIPEETRDLGHSLRYLVDKARGKEELERKRTARAAQLESETSEKMKRLKADDEKKSAWIIQEKMKGMHSWAEQMEQGTDDMYRQMYGENWKEIRALHLQKLALEQGEVSEKQKNAQVFLKERNAGKEVKITGFKF
ncbi:chromatin remodeling [Hyphodiscus hymeniophilus]|uniref:Chromatin remodeling n=1 Tax=Hyphodiscus hymeniophilus TaxID=353542 RepID=A0A9P7AVF9_9HELO|nr:chromatin remodeling [Hyphodiscus hymeniophilus]